MKIEKVITCGLTPRQIYILEQLIENDSQTMKELTTDFMSRVNLTNAIDVLEMKRFALRTRSANYNAFEDRRLVRVKITESGREKIESILK